MALPAPDEPITQLPTPSASVSTSTLASVTVTCLIRSRPDSSPSTSNSALARPACASDGSEPQGALPKRTCDNTRAGRGHSVTANLPDAEFAPGARLDGRGQRRNEQARNQQ